MELEASLEAPYAALQSAIAETVGAAQARYDKAVKIAQAKLDAAWIKAKNKAATINDSIVEVAENLRQNTVQKQQQSATMQATDRVVTNEGGGETFDPNNALALSTRFVNKMDPMWKNSENIKPINGYQDIVCHGDKTGFSYLDLDGNEINITPREFAEILKNSPVYEGQPIRLISCEAGADGSITAQYMANQLGVPVLAPTDIVYVYPDGVMKVGKYNTGRWVLFNPKER